MERITRKKLEELGITYESFLKLKDDLSQKTEATANISTRFDERKSQIIRCIQVGVSMQILLKASSFFGIS